MDREVAALVASAAENAQGPALQVSQEVLVAECVAYFGPFRELIDPYVDARLGGEADSAQKRDELALRLVSRHSGMAAERRVDGEVRRVRGRQSPKRG